MHAIR